MSMNLMDMIMGAAGGQAPNQIGQQFGLDAQQSQSAIAALLPAISSGLKRNASTPQGLGALLGAVQNGNHSQYFDNPSQLANESVVAEGNGILGHLFGSKDVSRAVAGRASEKSGISSSVLKKMLPMVAMMAMGSLGKQSGSTSPGAGFKGALGQLAMQQLMGGGRSQSSGLGGLLGGLMGGGARRQATQSHSQGLGMLGSMLDADGDGNSMDDLLGMLMKR